MGRGGDPSWTGEEPVAPSPPVAQDTSVPTNSVESWDHGVRRGGASSKAAPAGSLPSVPEAAPSTVLEGLVVPETTCSWYLKTSSKRSLIDAQVIEPLNEHVSAVFVPRKAPRRVISPMG